MNRSMKRELVLDNVNISYDCVPHCGGGPEDENLEEAKQRSKTQIKELHQIKCS